MCVKHRCQQLCRPSSAACRQQCCFRSLISHSPSCCGQVPSASSQFRCIVSLPRDCQALLSMHAKHLCCIQTPTLLPFPGLTQNKLAYPMYLRVVSVWLYGQLASCVSSIVENACQATADTLIVPLRHVNSAVWSACLMCVKHC